MSPLKLPQVSDEICGSIIIDGLPGIEPWATFERIEVQEKIVQFRVKATQVCPKCESEGRIWCTSHVADMDTVRFGIEVARHRVRELDENPRFTMMLRSVLAEIDSGTPDLDAGDCSVLIQLGVFQSVEFEH